MCRRAAWLGFLLPLLAGAAAVNAQTSTLSATADTYLRSGSPNQNQGSESLLRVQSSGNNRSLVRFDPAAITTAVGSGNLVGARLEFYLQSNANNWSTEGRTVDAHRLTANWTEAGATWNCGVDSIPSNSSPNCATQWAGGQFAEEPSDTVLHTNGLTGWIQFDVTADVLAFLSGTQNFGWIVKKTEEGQNGQVEYTSRQGAADHSPRLVLVVESASFDQVPPSLAITAPGRTVLVNEPSPTVMVAYRDGGSGVDPASFQLLIDGQDATPDCTVGTQSATCHPAPLAAGNHALQARLRDHAGNLAQASFSFQLLLGSGPHLVTLQAAGDTYLRKGESNQNQGAESILRIQQSGTNRALVQFDPQSLATTLSGATLVSATLELHIESNGRNWGTQGRTVDAHRVTAPWTEMGSTWNCPTDSNPANQQADCAAQWTGGSFAPTATASVLHTKDLEGWVSFNVTADVAAFLSGSPNYGWLLKKTKESQSGRMNYDSRQGTASEGPRLVMVFQASNGADTTPPAVAITAPAAGIYSATGTPTLTASFSDADSGVNLGSVRLLLEDVDRTAEAQVTATGLTWTSPQPLSDGSHAATIRVSDLAGNASQAESQLLVDASPPALSIVAPQEELLTEEPAIEVVVLLGDSFSGLDSATFTLAVDGAPFHSSCIFLGEQAVCQTPPLASGERSIEASVRDRAGHLASASRLLRLTVDRNPPALALLSPVDGSSVKTPSVTVSGTVSDDGTVTSVEVNGAPATVAGGTFSRSVSLERGSNGLLIVATDAIGRHSEILAQVRFDDVAPILEIESPRAGATSNFASQQVSGRVRDVSAIASLSLAGSPIPLTADGFSTQVALAEGSNVFELRAEDAAGNVATASIEVTRFTLPEVLITAPEDLAFVARTTVDVAGTVDDPAASVSVNGIAATVSGTAFLAQGVALIEGGNLLTATATSSQGHVATAHVQVVRDTTAPRLAVHSPREGEEFFESAVTVSGMVNDIVAGTVNLSEARVSVNGVAAEVANRAFLARGVPLAPGANTLQVEAIDATGNVGRATVHVTYQTAAEARLRSVSGDLQSAIAGTLLPQPLRVRLVDAAGLGLAGKPVLFKVKGNDGSLAGGKRQLMVTSDATGNAETTFKLGTRSGVGNQTVEALAVGFSGPVVFRATALPGAPALIVVDSGDHQVGSAGRMLPRPLVAVVTDSGFNRLPGVTVRFAVVKGEGEFEGGFREAVATTDSDGRAIVGYRLDPSEGVSNNVVEARIAALPAGPAAGFTATGWAAGDPAATAIRGVVLDNTNRPVPGVTLRIKGYPHTAQTDAAGTFRIGGAPVGTLYLIVDGSTADRPGSWPDLEFVVTTIPGREIDVGMPVYLLPIDLSNGIVVDETRAGTLRLPEVPGFALEIAPGSVTFPSGSRSGVVSVTVVHSDKIPMVPNFGQQPRLIVTIQPAGARFEPPARLTLPNLEGLAPGSVTELYSFDHDLGHFVSIGPATITEDGTSIVSNPGVGIIKAGWHCGGTPGSTGSSEDCPTCHSCTLNWCTADDAQPCSLSDPCKTNPRCRGGKCAGDDVTVTSIGGDCFGEVGRSVTFTAESNAPDKLEWQGSPDANPAEGSGGNYTTIFPSPGYKSVSAGCPTGDSKGKSLRVLESCSGGPPTPQWEKVAGSAACYGATVPVTVVTKPKECARSGKICSQLEMLKMQFSREVAGDCGIDIPEAGSQAVTDAIAANDCTALIDDLTPSTPSSALLGAPPRTKYWVEALTVAHEQYHEDQHLRPLVEMQFVPAVTALLQGDQFCGSGCGAPNFGNLEAEVKRVWSEKISGPWNEKQARDAREQDAYAADALKYNALVAGIRARCTPPPVGPP